MTKHITRECSIKALVTEHVTKHVTKHGNESTKHGNETKHGTETEYGTVTKHITRECSIKALVLMSNKILNEITCFEINSYRRVALLFAVFQSL